MKALAILLLLISIAANAKTKIIQFHAPGAFHATHASLFMEDGKIINIQKSANELLEKAQKAFTENRAIDYTITETGENTAALLDSITFEKEDMSAQEQEKDMYTWELLLAMDFQTRDPMEKAKITQLENTSQLNKVMNSFRNDLDKHKQCFNRAHVWSYETKVKHNVNLGKVWLFFTQKYIKTYNYKWWFHIAPFTEVNQQKYVLDKTYSKGGAQTVNSWKNMFIRNSHNCPVVSDYNEFYNKQNEAYCYIMYSSQYFWQPWHLEWLTNQGVFRYGYKMMDLKPAYEDVVKNWDGEIPLLTNLENGESLDTLGVQLDTIGTSLGNFKIGDRVIDHENDLGTIIDFIGDKARVDYDKLSKHYDMNLARLSLATNCVGSICVGKRIVDHENDLGTVLEVFENGKVYIDYDNLSKHYVLSRGKLAAGVTCLSGVCEGARIQDYENDYGTVLEVFENNKAYIDYDRLSKNYVMSFSKFSIID